jgi:transcriptional regulator with XRE-family HTH domain
MTTHATEGFIPEWTRGDRLRKARTALGVTVKVFSEMTLISEKTINDYEGDRIQRVSPLRLEKWANVTGVSQLWLETGEGEPTGPTGGAVSATNGYRTTRGTLARVA